MNILFYLVHAVFNFSTLIVFIIAFEKSVIKLAIPKDYLPFSFYFSTTWFTAIARSLPAIFYFLVWNMNVHDYLWELHEQNLAFSS